MFAVVLQLVANYLQPFGEEPSTDRNRKRKTRVDNRASIVCGLQKTTCQNDGLTGGGGFHELPREKLNVVVVAVRGHYAHSGNRVVQLTTASK